MTSKNLELGTEILRQLIKFDTTNPPGNEAACITYIDNLLKDEGFEPTIIGKTKNRPNLIVRLAGKGQAPPLLLYGHVDVVPTTNQDWTYPPFSAKVVDGSIWGRGALDMKGGVAMMLTALINLKRANFQPTGDIILAVLSDEEAGGELGAEFLVQHHQDIFKNVKFAIGEFGGFPVYMGRKKFYAIQVAEKQICWLKGSIKGPGGHASFPIKDGVIGKLAEVLQKFNHNRLPYHLLPAVEQMLSIMSANTDMPYKALLNDLTDPTAVASALEKIGPYGRMFDAMLHNTINTTVIQSGSKINVIPSEVQLEMDGRLLPGFDSNDVIREIKQLVGDDLKIEVSQYSQNLQQADLSMFEFFADILKKLDPEGIPVPILLSASTDARHFAKLGIQTYGFTPMNLPEDFNLMNYVHAADERIPIKALNFGTEAIQEALTRNMQ